MYGVPPHFEATLETNEQRQRVLTRHAQCLVQVVAQRTYSGGSRGEPPRQCQHPSVLLLIQVIYYSPRTYII